MPERELLVRIVGDDRALQAAFARSSRSAAQFEGRLATVGRGVSKGFAAAGIGLGIGTAIQLARPAIQAASDLNEEISKSEKIFGDSADAILAWSETTASAIGIAQTQALQATGIFGNLFNTVGLGQDQSAEMSQALVELAADLASFNNASPEDVLDAIRSGLIGEAEPLRRYGVLLSEARVQQVAMTNTGKDSARSLTNQEKALARYQIILQDTIPAQGDFADTASGFANQQRIAAAETQELAVSLGQLLLPAAQLTLGSIIGLTRGINNLVDATHALREDVKDSHFADGFNSAVDGAAKHASDFFLGLRDGIPFLTQFREGVQGIFDATPNAPPTPTGPQRAAGRRAARRQAVDDAERGDAVIARVEAANRRADDLRGRLSDSETRAAHIRDLIREDPDNATLAKRLSTELALQKSLREQIATAAAAAARADAAAAKSAQDAAAAATAEANARRQAAREAAIERRNANQFEALGLTREGERRVPGIGALRRRGETLEKQIEGTTLDTAATRQKLARIARVLSGQFGAVGREVREAILEMFNTISSALDEGTDSVNKGPRTRFRVANTSNVLAGLGLSEDQEKALRSRLSRLGVGGTTSQTSSTGGAFGVDVHGGGNIVINGDVNVHANDTDEFGRELERKGRRSGRPRTGNFAGHKN